MQAGGERLPPGSLPVASDRSWCSRFPCSLEGDTDSTYGAMVPRHGTHEAPRRLRKTAGPGVLLRPQDLLFSLETTRGAPTCLLT